MATYRSDVYVADIGNYAVKEILADGTIHTIGGPWELPSGIDLDSKGNLYVSDLAKQAVYKATPKRDAVQIADASSCPDPGPLTTDPSQNVYVICDERNIIEIAPNGHISPVGGQWDSPLGIAIDKKSNLYVTQYRGGLWEYSVEGVQTQLATKKQIPGAGSVSYLNGSLYVASYFSSAIYKVASPR